MKTIKELSESNLYPNVEELPPIPKDWRGPVTLGEVYGPAMRIYDPYEAEKYLLRLVALRIYRDGPKTWQQVIAREREELAFYALGCDVSRITEKPVVLQRIRDLFGGFFRYERGLLPIQQKEKRPSRFAPGRQSRKRAAKKQLFD